jgi:hypothetical protein
MYENMEDELQLFDVPPKLSEFLLWAKKNFDGDFYIEGEF